MDNENKNIFSKIRELRRARGLTVNTLAQKMGENYQKVGRIERGTRSLTVDYLMKVARALETPVETLLGEDKKGEKGNALSAPSSDILNNVIELVEEYAAKVKLSSKQKAKMIAQIYQQVLKFPVSEQSLFLSSTFELMVSARNAEESD